MIGEQPNGSVTEVESRDVDFIENEFPSRGEVDKDLTLYEMMDPNEGAPSSLVENRKKFLKLLGTVGVTYNLVRAHH